VARKFEERMVAIARREAPETSLEGIFVAARPGEAGAVVAPPHPLYGGSMDSPVVNEIAWGCNRAGIASLRFNWRGVGASAGEVSGEPADADADYQAALEHLAETVRGPLVACGYSFGAAAAVRASAGRERVERLVLVAPPPGLVDPDSLVGLRRPVLVLVGERDTIAPPERLAEALDGNSLAALRVVPGADHFFGIGLARIGRLTFEWLRPGEGPSSEG
jgi:alpha/beta superfamily hydrolase